jgi:hypothetical protein
MRRDPFEARPWREAALSALIFGAAAVLMIGLTALALLWLGF